MEKLIITAAICGAEVLKEHNPAVPYTVEECAREAKSAYDAGASIIHLHVRNDDGQPTQDKNRFKQVMDAIRAVCPDVIIQPSTGGAVGMTNDERLQPTELLPEMATLDCGTLNFGGDEIFENTENTIKYFGQTNYVATKAGLIGMTKTMARELGRKGITVNAVAPGFIETEMVAKMPENVLDGMRAKVPVGRLGRPEEIAAAYLYLASDEAAYVNGAVLSVDGGMTV